MVRTSLNSFVVLIKRFFRLSTTVVECVVVSLDMFPLLFCELQTSCKSTTAEFSAVISCLMTAVNSWISIVGSSKTDVLFATATEKKKHLYKLLHHYVCSVYIMHTTQKRIFQSTLIPYVKTHTHAHSFIQYLL